MHNIVKLFDTSYFFCWLIVGIIVSFNFGYDYLPISSHILLLHMLKSVIHVAIYGFTFGILAVIVRRIIEIKKINS